MAVNLDTRLPLAAVGSPLNPAGVLQNARANAIQQKLDEMRMDYESRKRRRETDTERYMGEAINAIRQGKPAQTVTDFQWNTPNQTGVPQSPYEMNVREVAPAVPGRQPTLEDMQAASIDAMFKAGDIQGAFEAMKAARTGQASQAKPFGAETKRGPDGMEYALNMMTGRYEPTGFSAERDPAKPRIQIVRTARGIEVVDLNNLPPGTVLPPEKKPEAKRAPRTQVVTDETGTFVIDLDNPSAPAVPVTKPGGAAIVKPPAGGGSPTEDERKAAGWLAQAENAWNNMSNIIKKNPRAIEQGLMERVVPEGVANVVRSEHRQMFLHGARSLAEAALRAATGAGVNYEEARQKIEELTPVYGDKPAVIKQKLDSIKVYIDALKSRAGRALPKQAQVGQSQSQPQRQQVNILPPASQLPGRIATDNATGIRYKSDGTKWVRVP